MPLFREIGSDPGLPERDGTLGLPDRKAAARWCYPFDP
jgi:hypothetical protein